MIELVISEREFEAIRFELLGRFEGCAVMYGSRTTRTDGTVRILVREVEVAGDGDYNRRGELEAELTPIFVARVTKRARLANLSLVFVHSHPGDLRLEPAHADVLEVPPGARGA